MQKFKQNTLGIVLAGGASFRMHKNKANMVFAGKKLLTHALICLKKTGLENVCTSGNFTNVQYVVDIIPNLGPVGGIYSVIMHPLYANFRFFLIIPVDMPLLMPMLLERLFVNILTAQAVFYENTLFPLLLKKSSILIQIIEALLKKGGYNCSIRDLLSQLSFETIPILKEEKKYFINTNTIESWEHLSK